MLRLLPILALAAPLMAFPVYAADYPDYGGDCCFKPAYGDDMSGDYDDQLDFEIGLRNWLSWGQNRMTVLGGNYSQADTSDTLELHLRIDDRNSNVYVKALGGYSAVINSSYTTPLGGPTTSSLGHIGYAGGDIGYQPMGTDTFRFGGFAGYQYWDDSPDMGRVNYLTGSQPNTIFYHMLRLGLSANADFGAFDVSAEAAVIPYATVNGTYGALAVPVPAGVTQNSPGSLSGWLYGAAGEVMARWHPTEDWTVGIGGRAWYLTGQANMSFRTSSGEFITSTQQYSALRTGLLAEVTYRF